MNIDQLIKAMQEEGYRYYDNAVPHMDPYLAKRHKDHRACECNHEKAGIQVVVTLHSMDIHGERWESVEVDVTGEFRGHWYKLSAYSLPVAEFYEKRNEIIDSLLASWDNLA